jgi:hypothetical protein
VPVDSIPLHNLSVAVFNGWTGELIGRATFGRFPTLNPVYYPANWALWEEQLISDNRVAFEKLFDGARVEPDDNRVLIRYEDVEPDDAGDKDWASHFGPLMEVEGGYEIAVEGFGRPMYEDDWLRLDGETETYRPVSAEYRIRPPGFRNTKTRLYDLPMPADAAGTLTIRDGHTGDVVAELPLGEAFSTPGFREPDAPEYRTPITATLDDQGTLVITGTDDPERITLFENDAEPGRLQVSVEPRAQRFVGAPIGSIVTFDTLGTRGVATRPPEAVDDDGPIVRFRTSYGL